MDQVTSVRRLLVPLDGSSLAQGVMSAVSALAKAFGAEVILIHVLEQHPPGTVHGEKHLTDGFEAKQYLEKVAESLVLAGVAVETHVHEIREGDIPRSIVQHAEEYSPDLIVLCAHGKHGLKSFVSGRVGQQVLLRGTSPVLILQPSTSPFELKAIVVPVDTTHGHDLALDLSAALAQAFDAELHLISVIPTLATLDIERSRTGLLLPSAMRAILDIDQETGAEQLEKMVADYRSKGIKAFSQVLRGDTVGEVLKRSNRLEAGLVVMTTHGSFGA